MSIVWNKSYSVEESENVDTERYKKYYENGEYPSEVHEGFPDTNAVYVCEANYYGSATNTFSLSVNCEKPPVEVIKIAISYSLILPGGNQDVIGTLILNRGSENFSFRAGMKTDVVSYEASSNTNVAYSSANVAVEGGAIMYFCYVRVGSTLRHSYYNVKPGPRRVIVCKSVEVDKNYVSKSGRGKLVEYIDKIRLEVNVEKRSVQAQGEVRARICKNVVDNRCILWRSGPKVDVHGTTSGPKTPDEDKQILSLEEAVEAAKDVFAISARTDLRFKLYLDDITDISIPEFLPPGFLPKQLVRTCFDNIYDACATGLGVRSNDTEIILLIALIQGALTYSTCEYYTSEYDEIVHVHHKNGRFDFSYTKAKTVIRETVGESYANPVRKLMRWFTANTVELIKIGKVTPNYAVMARHGVVNKYIPYCFDYCVMDARYNTRDEKIAYALSAIEAIYGSRRRKGRQGEIHNVSELQYLDT